MTTARWRTTYHYEELFAGRFACGTGTGLQRVVTDFMFVFGTVKAGFAQVDAPYILCWTNSWLNNGYQFANRTDVGGLHGGQWIMATDRWGTNGLQAGCYYSA